jgi:prevent-host-death family protein
MRVKEYYIAASATPRRGRETATRLARRASHSRGVRAGLAWRARGVRAVIAARPRGALPSPCTMSILYRMRKTYGSSGRLLPRVVNATYLRARLADTMNRVRYGGERVILRRHGAAVAAIVSIEDLQTLRTWEHNFVIGPSGPVPRDEFDDEFDALRKKFGF